jgi:hypothetical protein
MDLRVLLIVNIVLQLVLFVVALNRLRGDYRLKTKRYLFIFGSFVWEDALVFSLFWIISSLILLYLNSLKALIALILIFIIVRGLGELIYSLFQQFQKDETYRPFDFGFRHLHRRNIFIIYQVLALSAVTLAAFLLYLVSDSAF